MQPKIFIPEGLTVTDPFFYIIRHKLSGRLYAGSKYGKKSSRGVCDSSVFMTEEGYLTSSKCVNDLLKSDGLHSFIILCIRHFKTAKEAYTYETAFLHKVNAKDNLKYLNRSNGGLDFRCIGPLSNEHKEALSKANKGKTLSIEQKKKLSEAAKNRQSDSEETRKKKGDSNRGKKISDKQKDQISKANTGRIPSEQERENMRKAAKNKLPVTDEARKNNSKAQIGKSLGKHWYTNEITNEYCFNCPEGDEWRPGMKKRK